MSSSRLTLKRRGRQITDTVVRHSLQGASNARDRLFRAQHLNQAGQTPFEVIAERDIVKLRYYPPLQDRQIKVQGETLNVAQKQRRIPLVIVPPLAVNMLIYDLFPQRSLVRYLRASGYALYLIDWGRPTRRHNHLHMADYFGQLLPWALAQVRQHSGESELSLHGWSMGAIFAYCYAALGDPSIRNLILLGPPCDYHAEGGVNWQNRLFSRQMKRLHRLTGFKPHATPRRWWRAPGWANSMAFKLASPAGTLRGYSELLGRLHDRDFVSSHATNAAFLDDMVAYPGGVMQDVAQYLLTDNVLAQGKLPMSDPPAGLSAVRNKVLMLVGEQDPIVSPASSTRLLELIESRDTQLSKVPGGHMSIVSGSRTPAEVWPLMREWLDQRSN